MKRPTWRIRGFLSIAASWPSDQFKNTVLEQTAMYHSTEKEEGSQTALHQQCYTLSVTLVLFSEHKNYKAGKAHIWTLEKDRPSTDLLKSITQSSFPHSKIGMAQIWLTSVLLFGPLVEWKDSTQVPDYSHIFTKMGHERLAYISSGPDEGHQCCIPEVIPEVGYVCLLSGFSVMMS